MFIMLISNIIITLLWLDFNNNLIIQYALYTPTSANYQCMYPLTCNAIHIYLTTLVRESGEMWGGSVWDLSNNKRTNTYFTARCWNANASNAYNRTLSALIIGY